MEGVPAKLDMHQASEHPRLQILGVPPSPLPVHIARRLVVLATYQSALPVRIELQVLAILMTKPS